MAEDLGQAAHAGYDVGRSSENAKSFLATLIFG